MLGCTKNILLIRDQTFQLGVEMRDLRLGIEKLKYIYV